GKTNLVSTGWTRGHKPTLVAGGNEPRGSGGSGAAGSAAPARGASARPATAGYAGSNVTAIGAVARKLENEAEPVTAFRRDYEERAADLAEEIEAENLPDLFEDDSPSATTALFSDKAAADAASARAEASRAEARPADDAKAIAAQRRQKALMQGYTGDMCSNCNSTRMKVSGHCQVCEDCGTTTGCS
ncbi:MAG: hypothetical protein AB7E84_21100, partial [Xanthobacteraceae bacterium]